MSEEDREQAERQHDDGFVPRGAIAFMVVMVLAYGAVWFALYFLMTGRS